MTLPPGYDAWRLAGPHDDECCDCGGEGWINCPECDGAGCPKCGGTGGEDCPTCGGDEPDGDYLYEQARDRAMEGE